MSGRHAATPLRPGAILARAAELLLLWTHGELWRSLAALAALANHTVSGDPARVVDFGLDLLPSHLFYDIGYSNPQHADWQGMLSRFIVDGELDLIRLVNVEAMIFRLPSIVTGGASSGHDIVLNLDGDERLRASSETTCGGVVHILDGNNSDGELAGQGLSEIGQVDRVI